MAKRLIVNADDYGYTPGVSAGIREAHQRGIVTSATVMMNMPSAQNDLRLAREDCPDLGLGIHLTMTAGRPLRPSEAVPTLATRDGTFLRLEELRAAYPRICRGHLRDEWRAQIETFLGSGGRPDHLDSHHHASYLHQKGVEVMLELAEEYSLPVRWPFGEGAANTSLEGVAAEEWTKLGDFARHEVVRRDVRHPNGLIIEFYAVGATLENLARLVNDLPEGSHELMCHPGHSDTELLAGSSYSVGRERELSILVSPRIRNLVWDNQIDLINFGQL